MYKISIKEIQQIIQMLKNLKFPIVYSDGNILYGTDEDFCILRQIILPGGINIVPMCVSISILDDFIKEYFYIEEFMVNGNTLLASGTIACNIIEPYLLNRMQRLICTINNMKSNNQPNIFLHDMLQNEMFAECIIKKASEGPSRIIIHNNYIITVYKNLIPINKGDEVSLSIRDIDNETFMCTFHVNKKKIKNIIETNMLYLKLY